MSHVVLGEGRIDQTAFDLEAVRLACQDLGLVFCQGVPTWQWYGVWVNDYHGKDAAYRQVKPEQFGHGKHMLRLPWSLHEEEIYAKDPQKRPYEIGLIEMPDGRLAMIFD